MCVCARAGERWREGGLFIEYIKVSRSSAPAWEPPLYLCNVPRAQFRYCRAFKSQKIKSCSSAIRGIIFAGYKLDARYVAAARTVVAALSW